MWPLFTSVTTDKIELYISTLLCNLVSVANRVPQFEHCICSSRHAVILNLALPLTITIQVPFIEHEFYFGCFIFSFLILFFR